MYTHTYTHSYAHIHHSSSSSSSSISVQDAINTRQRDNQTPPTSPTAHTPARFKICRHRWESWRHIFGFAGVCRVSESLMCSTAWYRVDLLTPYTPDNENSGTTSVDAQVCVGCQKVWCVLLHGFICILSHPTVCICRVCRGCRLFLRPLLQEGFKYCPFEFAVRGRMRIMYVTQSSCECVLRTHTQKLQERERERCQ